TFDPNKHVDWRADDVVLSSGKTVRRVQLKFVPGIRMQFNIGRRRGPFGNADGTQAAGERPPPPTPMPMVSLPWIIVHAAAEPIKRDAAIARLKAISALNLEEQTTAARDELSRLRQRLWLIG